MIDVHAKVIDLHPETYIRGGAVRDMILGRTPHDIDFFCIGDYETLLTKFDEAFDWAVAMGKHHNTFVFSLDKVKYEVNVLPNISEAPKRSDFTINSMLISPMNEIIDPLNGMKDLKKKVLRQSMPDSIQTDPIRAMRAVRFKHGMGFTFADETKIAVQYSIPRIILCWDGENGLSKYRSWNELQKHFALGNGKSISELSKYGLKMPFAPFRGNDLTVPQAIAKSLKKVKDRQGVYTRYGINTQLRKEIEDEISR